MAGVSYYTEDAKQASDTHAFTDSIDTVLSNLGLAGTPDGTLFGFTSDVLAAIGIPATMRGLPWREVMNNEGTFSATAVFGDVIWHATDRLNVTFGLRYTHDEKEFSWLNGPREAPELDATVAALDQMGFFEIRRDSAGGVQLRRRVRLPADSVGDQLVQIEGERVRLKDSWDDISPRLVLDYPVTPDVMVFGSLAKGYKAGGYNSVQPLSQFDNEDVWNIEGGVKSLFADLGLIVNASVFYYQYDDKQSISLVCAEGEVCRYLVDSSDDEAYGLDVDARWQPTNALTLTATVAYIDATYKELTSRRAASTCRANRLVNRAGRRARRELRLDHGNVRQASTLSAMHAYRGESRCNANSQLQGTCQVESELHGGRGNESHGPATGVDQRRRSLSASRRS